jgi:hypothetical protein
VRAANASPFDVAAALLELAGNELDLISVQDGIATAFHGTGCVKWSTKN